MSTFLWWISSITIVITYIYQWLLLNPFIVGDVDHLLGGFKVGEYSIIFPHFVYKTLEKVQFIRN